MSLSGNGLSAFEGTLASDHLFRQLVETTDAYALLLLDRNGIVISWNPGAERIKGFRSEQIIGRHFSCFYTAEAVAIGHPERELEMAALTGRYTEEGWRMRVDGSRFWARVELTALRDDDGEVIAFSKVTTDLTERRQGEEQLRNVFGLLEQATRIDHLTGLPNRRAWDERLAEEVARAERDDLPLTVVMLDLDHFKRVNDEQGHASGDQLLKRCALAWRKALRPTDILARYGGEEFTLALIGCDATSAPEIVERLQGMTPRGQTCSAGAATWDRREDIDHLIGRADQAMYVAKHGGGGRFVIADEPPRLAAL
jgi:diguanylate cyclase (GGDEF)-like protein/PAS domain S-box-containing protein